MKTFLLMLCFIGFDVNETKPYTEFLNEGYTVIVHDYVLEYVKDNYSHTVSFTEDGEIKLSIEIWKYDSEKQGKKHCRKLIRKHKTKKSHHFREGNNIIYHNDTKYIEYNDRYCEVVYSNWKPIKRKRFWIFGKQ